MWQRQGQRTWRKSFNTRRASRICACIVSGRARAEAICKQLDGGKCSARGKRSRCTKTVEGKGTTRAQCAGAEATSQSLLVIDRAATRAIGDAEGVVVIPSRGG